MLLLLLLYIYICIIFFVQFFGSRARITAAILRHTAHIHTPIPTISHHSCYYFNRVTRVYTARCMFFPFFTFFSLSINKNPNGIQIHKQKFWYSNLGFSKLKHSLCVPYAVAPNEWNGITVKKEYMPKITERKVSHATKRKINRRCWLICVRFAHHSERNQMLRNNICNLIECEMWGEHGWIHCHAMSIPKRKRSYGGGGLK